LGFGFGLDGIGNTEFPDQAGEVNAAGAFAGIGHRFGTEQRAFEGRRELFFGKQSLGERLWVTATAARIPMIVKKPKTD